MVETALGLIKEEIKKNACIADALLPLALPIASWCDSPFLFKRQVKVVKKALVGVKEVCDGNSTRAEVKRLLTPFLLTPEKKTPTKRRGRKRVFNRNPAVNAMLEEEEEKQDNYDDLADFIDPTPDHSLQNGDASMFVSRVGSTNKPVAL